MHVPSHLMTGGRFSQIVDRFPCPLLSPSSTSLLPSPRLPSPPLPSPSLPSFLSFLFLPPPLLCQLGLNIGIIGIKQKNYVCKLPSFFKLKLCNGRMNH